MMLHFLPAQITLPVTQHPANPPWLSYSLVPARPGTRLWLENQNITSTLIETTQTQMFVQGILLVLQ